MAQITEIRQALWLSLDQSGVLDRFRAQYRFDDDSQVLAGVPPRPALGDCPAIAIRPSGQIGSDWVLNTDQEFAVPFAISIWSAGWSLPFIEWAQEAVIGAVIVRLPEINPAYYVAGAIAMDNTVLIGQDGQAGPMTLAVISFTVRGGLWRPLGSV